MVRRYESMSLSHTGELVLVLPTTSMKKLSHQSLVACKPLVITCTMCDITENYWHYFRNKPRGLPEVGQMAPVPMNATDWSSTRPRDANTPFRLPRLYGGVDQSPGSESLSSYQHMDYVTPSPDIPYRSR